FLVSGVTGVRHMFSFNPLFSPKQWRKNDAPRNARLPHLVAADTLLEGPQPSFPWPITQNIISVKTAAEAMAVLKTVKDQGEDFITVYPTIPRDIYFALAAEARRVAMPLVGHVPPTVTVAEASEAGQASIEHLDGVALSCSRQGEGLRADFCSRLGHGGLD